MRIRVAALVCAGLLAGGRLAAAQPAPAPVIDDPSFGPLLEIERIQVTGNQWSADRVIRRALPVHEGDVLRAGDRRLQSARFKVLALGFFRSVELTLQKGSARGKVILVVEVVERGTVVLNQLYFGTSRANPWWAGADLTERNFLGTGIGVGGGFVWVDDGDISGQRHQWAGELRLADESIVGTTLGAHAGVLYKKASEPYRVAGDDSDDDPGNFLAFPYSRAGGAAGLSLAVTPLSRLAVDLRVERVRASPPAAPTRELPDGRVVGVDLHMPPGTSHLVAVALGFDRDTRADPVLPYGGDRLVVLAQLGAGFLGGSWDYLSALARYQHWWPVHGLGHVVSVHLQGGVVLGDAPLFERLHVGDFDRLLTPRAAGLVVSTDSSSDPLGTGADRVTYGEVGGSVAIEYSYRLFRRNHRIYGGDLFAGAGLWTLADRDALRVRDRSLATALPLDLFVDVGLRLDTEIGIFELTLANALGRVPL